MTGNQNTKERELVMQIRMIDADIEHLKRLKMAKVRELAVLLRDNHEHGLRDLEIPWVNKDIAEINLLAMDS